MKTISPISVRALESAYANALTIWRSYRRQLSPAGQDALRMVVNQIRIGLEGVTRGKTAPSQK